MRLVLGGAVCLVLASCAQRAPRQLAGDGEMVLELGGGGASLSRLLQKSGVELLPAPQPLPQPAPVSESSTDSGSQAVEASGKRNDGVGLGDEEPLAKTSTKPEKTAESKPDSKPDAKPEADGGYEVIEVTLGASETLMDLASKHLGTARRFKDIMKWNGWTDRDARRLKAGTKVKIHKPSKAAASR